MTYLTDLTDIQIKIIRKIMDDLDYNKFDTTEQYYFAVMTRFIISQGYDIIKTGVPKPIRDEEKELELLKKIHSKYSSGKRYQDDEYEYFVFMSKDLK